jgi:hypothetical protein
MCRCSLIIPDCRIQNAVYMVNEKGADLIKAVPKDIDYGLYLAISIVKRFNIIEE